MLKIDHRTMRVDIIAEIKGKDSVEERCEGV